MKNKYESVLVTLKERNECPIGSGKYPTRKITLNKAFLDMALSKPAPPRYGLARWRKSEDGKINGLWNNLSTRMKIKLRLNSIASDLGSTLSDFEII